MSRTSVGITLDVDWAPDFVIDYVADLLIERAVPATWFVTHASPALERLRKRPELFELGIHPNFLPNSTHGNNTSEVLVHIMDIVPEATSMRSHAVVQSGPLLAEVVERTPVNVDSTIFLPEMPNIVPVEHLTPAGVLRRVPFFWADDYEMLKSAPTWDPEALMTSPGCKIFMFHPIHVYLNSPNMEMYSRVKQSIGNLTDASTSTFKDQKHSGPGARTMFLALINSPAATSFEVVREIARKNLE